MSVTSLLPLVFEADNLSGRHCFWVVEFGKLGQNSETEAIKSFMPSLRFNPLLGQLSCLLVIVPLCHIVEMPHGSASFLYLPVHCFHMNIQLQFINADAIFLFPLSPHSILPPVLHSLHVSSSCPVSFLLRYSARPRMHCPSCTDCVYRRAKGPLSPCNLPASPMHSAFLLLSVWLTLDPCRRLHRRPARREWQICPARLCGSLPFDCLSLHAIAAERRGISCAEKSQITTKDNFFSAILKHCRANNREANIQNKRFLWKITKTINYARLMPYEVN